MKTVVKAGVGPFFGRRVDSPERSDSSREPSRRIRSPAWSGVEVIVGFCGFDGVSGVTEGEAGTGLPISWGLASPGVAARRLARRTDFTSEAMTSRSLLDSSCVQRVETWEGMGRKSGNTGITATGVE
jgi:hypothetical protein